MKICRFIILIVSTFISIPALANEPKKVLIVASNLIHMGDPEQHDARNNLWEVAPPYHIFISHGYDVDFVSPKGGAVPFMMDPLGISAYTIKYEGFLDKAKVSLTPEQVNPNDYWAVFMGGGYGPVFDVANDEDIHNIIAQIYESGGIAGVGGHGAASMVNVKLSNGEFLVKGKRVAGFPNSTELKKSYAKQGTLLPFLIENRLNENGAIALNKTTLANKHDVVIDQRLVSTMFLPSAANVAKEMIELHRSSQ